MNEVISAPEAVAKLVSVSKEPVLRVVNGSKIYGGVHAIENIDFDLYAGEVHGLLGRLEQRGFQWRHGFSRD